MSKNLLVVDDEELILELYSDFFEQEGFQVDTADTVDRALSKMKESSSLDLVISDVKLPYQTGFDLYDEMENENIDIPVIFMTGFDYKTDIAKKLDDLGVIWFSKPVKLEELLEQINEILE